MKRVSRAPTRPNPNRSSAPAARLTVRAGPRRRAPSSATSRQMAFIGTSTPQTQGPRSAPRVVFARRGRRSRPSSQRRTTSGSMNLRPRSTSARPETASAASSTPTRPRIPPQRPPASAATDPEVFYALFVTVRTRSGLRPRRRTFGSRYHLSSDTLFLFDLPPCR